MPLQFHDNDSLLIKEWHSCSTYTSTLYERTRQAMCVLRNIMGRSHNVYASSRVQKASYHFIRRGFNGNFMWPATIKRTQVSV